MKNVNDNQVIEAPRFTSAIAPPAFIRPLIWLFDHWAGLVLVSHPFFRFNGALYTDHYAAIPFCAPPVIIHHPVSAEQ